MKGLGVTVFFVAALRRLRSSSSSTFTSSLRELVVTGEELGPCDGEADGTRDGCDVTGFLDGRLEGRELVGASEGPRDGLDVTGALDGRCDGDEVAGAGEGR